MLIKKHPVSGFDATYSCDECGQHIPSHETFHPEQHENHGKADLCQHCASKKQSYRSLRPNEPREKLSMKLFK